MYLVTWVTLTGAVRRETFGTLLAARKRLTFLLSKHHGATLEAR